jgi:hypothetical protein
MNPIGSSGYLDNTTKANTSQIKIELVEQAERGTNTNKDRFPQFRLVAVAKPQSKDTSLTEVHEDGRPPVQPAWKQISRINCYDPIAG